MSPKLLLHASIAAACLFASPRAEAVGELIELLLTPRTIDDQPITPDGSGVFHIEVDEPFVLEVSYNELRLFSDRLGAEDLYTDIWVSHAGVLQPILNETQRVIIGEELAQNRSGTMTFGIEGSATTHVSQWIDLANDPRQELVDALGAFGYSPSQYELTSLDFGNDDIGFQIHWVGEEFADLDLPDLVVLGDFPIFVPIQFAEFAPRQADGVSINGHALPFNIDTFSRTFNDDEPFYSSLVRGTFDPALGFEDVGGAGPILPEGAGIPQLTDDGGFITPFDAFSIRVKFTAEVTGFVASVGPGEDVASVLLYGRTDPVPPGLVLTDQDASATFAVPEPSGDALGAVAAATAVAWTAARRSLSSTGPRRAGARPRSPSA